MARPIEADNHERFGDYEGDTMIGNAHKGVLETLVDRRNQDKSVV